MMLVFMSRDDVTWCLDDGGGSREPSFLSFGLTLIRMAHSMRSSQTMSSRTPYATQAHRET